MKVILLPFMALLFFACNSNSQEAAGSVVTSNQIQDRVINHPKTVGEIPFPANYKKAMVAKNSFEEYLRALPLKPKGSLVKYYNGSIKVSEGVYDFVIDLPIGNKNLHQCADAIIRLKAEYLWNQKRYDEIHFNFTNGFTVEFKEWMKGRRMIIEGNKTYWDNGTNASNSYDDFWDYLELIFTYAGTASLEKELIQKNLVNAEIGDILIQEGHPGHAIIIVDKATNEKTGDHIFLLAQSYMPAQEIQILKNPSEKGISSWYSFDTDQIETPEWTFTSSDLKVFQK